MTIENCDLLLQNENAGMLKAIKQLRAENKKLQADLKEARQQIRELTERIAQLEDIDSLPSEDDKLAHEGE